jgi:cellulase/cellobiase CelA1
MQYSFLTADDVSNYGSDLINFAQRAAAQALSPELQEIKQQNAEMQRRLAQEQRHRLDQTVEQAVPNYREIDRDPGWHRWLLSTDALSGCARQQLLNDAIARGDAPRVIGFFHSFMREAGGPADHQAPAQSRQPRASAPSGRIYSRREISKLYDQHRRGAYVGREAEWARLEFDIIRAGAEGRIAGGLELNGK